MRYPESPKVTMVGPFYSLNLWDYIWEHLCRLHTDLPQLETVSSNYQLPRLEPRTAL